MSKLGYIILLIFIIARGLVGQNVYFESFDSLNAGSSIAIQSDSLWTTWDQLPGTIQDPLIVNDTAYSDSNSLFITDNNDAIFLLNDKTSGKFCLQFFIYVYADSNAYFSVLQDFSGNASKTGLQAFFRKNKRATFDAGGRNAYTMGYTPNTWIRTELYIDLDEDFAILYTAGVERIKWKWSDGAFGRQGILKLDAVNFYGWNQEDTSGFNIDDLYFAQADTLHEAMNLTDSVSNDSIFLFWDKPIGDSASYFSIYRNGEKLSNKVTGTSFVDAGLLPGNYHYQVKAFYRYFGFSASSNEVINTISGGTERNFVLFENATGTWCQSCTANQIAISKLFENQKNVAVINYNYIDDFQNSFTSDRISYYKITGYPTSLVDGKATFIGAAVGEELYPDFIQAYEENIAKPSVFNISHTDTLYGDTLFFTKITVEKIKSYYTTDIAAHVVITLSNQSHEWFGQETVNYQCINMLPNANGTTLNFKNDTVLSFGVNFDWDDFYIENVNNLELIIFLQLKSSKEVLQVVKTDFKNLQKQFKSGFGREKLVVYPNPAQDVIFLNQIENDGEKGNYAFKIFNRLGQKVMSGKNSIDEKIDIRSLNSGIYLLWVQTETKSYSTKFIVSQKR